jgi:hypothetical protein
MWRGILINGINSECQTNIVFYRQN